jgi:hypothetical protein
MRPVAEGAADWRLRARSGPADRVRRQRGPPAAPNHRAQAADARRHDAALLPDGAIPIPVKMRDTAGVLDGILLNLMSDTSSRGQVVSLTVTAKRRSRSERSRRALRYSSVSYPKMTVRSDPDNIAVTHLCSEGESYTYNVDPYSVQVERHGVKATAKSIREWVRCAWDRRRAADRRGVHLQGQRRNLASRWAATLLGRYVACLQGF